jgi:arylsulfatase A-like enzyme
MVDGYDTAISYADENIGRILAALDELGILHDTAVILSADHGECLGELNAYGGHCFADACTTRVPLIVRWPGVTDALAGRCDDGLHYHFDLAATVNALLGARIPAEWDAESMMAALRGKKDAARNHLVVSQLAQTCQRAVLFCDGGSAYLYLRTFRSGFYPIPRELLFDISRDPHEIRDIARERCDLTTGASELLDGWSDAMLQDRGHDDPIRTVLAEPPARDLGSYIGRLKDTGREDWIREVARREAEERRNSG